MVAGTAEHCRKQLDRYGLKGRKNPHEHDAYDHESRVAVLDVREFVAHDGREFCIVQFLDEAGRERDGKRGDVNAARECIQTVVFDNVDLRHFDAACNAKIFDNVIDAQVVLAFERLGMRGVADNGGVCAIGDNEPHAHNLERVRQCGLKSVPYFGPMHHAILHVCRVLGGATTHQGAEHTEIIHDDDCRKDHSQNNKREHAQQQNTVAVVPPNLGLKADVFH